MDSAIEIEDVVKRKQPKRKQVACSPLNWKDQFLMLISKMSHEISLRPTHPNSLTLAKYQTVIAAGCYTGERAKVLLSFRWVDLLNEKETVLKQSKVFRNRKVFIHPDLVSIAEKNQLIVKPESDHFPILHNERFQPISTISFNTQLRKYFERYEIETDNPSSHTLRKTFGTRLFEVEGGDVLALATVQKALGHRSPEYTADYLGVTWKKVRLGLEKM